LGSAGQAKFESQILGWRQAVADYVNEEVQRREAYKVTRSLSAEKSPDVEGRPRPNTRSQIGRRGRNVPARLGIFAAYLAR
jgi:hypothetical protein